MNVSHFFFREPGVYNMTQPVANFLCYTLVWALISEWAHAADGQLQVAVGRRVLIWHGHKVQLCDCCQNEGRWCQSCSEMLIVDCSVTFELMGVGLLAHTQNVTMMLLELEGGIL